MQSHILIGNIPIALIWICKGLIPLLVIWLTPLVTFRKHGTGPNGYMLGTDLNCISSLAQGELSVFNIVLLNVCLLSCILRCHKDFFCANIQTETCFHKDFYILKVCSWPKGWNNLIDIHYLWWKQI